MYRLLFNNFRHLETVASELQKKSELLLESNSRLAIEVEALKIQLDALRNDKERMMSERNDLAVSHQKNLEVRRLSRSLVFFVEISYQRVMFCTYETCDGNSAILSCPILEGVNAQVA